MSTPIVHTLIKFGSKDRMDAFRTRGEVYLNTWGYFKNLEANPIQGDQDEGLQLILQVSRGAQFRWGSEAISGLVDQILMHRGDVNDYNIYCMFALTEESFSFLDDPRLLTFGDTAVMMTLGDEFLARLRKKLDSEGVKHTSRLVEYVDRESFHGEMGPFRKLKPFAYQSEFRFLAHARKGGPLKVDIGDISDISISCPTEELKNGLQLVPAP